MAGDHGPLVLGGWTLPTPATDVIQEMIDGVKNKAEDMVRNTFAMFKAISYRSQLVEGMNYNVTVQISFDASMDLKIFKSLGDEVSLIEAIEVQIEPGPAQLLGPIPQPEAVTLRIQLMVDEFKQLVEYQTGQCYDEIFVALSFRAQCEDGINYLILVQVSERDVIQLAMYESFLGVVQLTGIAKGVPPCIPGPFAAIPSQHTGWMNFSVPTLIRKILDTKIEGEVRVLLKEILPKNSFDVFDVTYCYSELNGDGFTYTITVQISVSSIIHLTLFQSFGGQVMLTNLSIPQNLQQVPFGPILPPWFPYYTPSPATQRIQNMVDEMKDEIVRNGVEFDMLKAISYCGCPANGINFSIRVQVKQNSFIGLTINESLKGTIVLTGIRKLKVRSPYVWLWALFGPVPQSMYVPATEITQDMVNSVKEEAQQLVKKTFAEFKAIYYRSAFTCDIDYYVTVMVSNESFVELEISPSLDDVATIKQVIDGVDQYIARSNSD